MSRISEEIRDEGEGPERLGWLEKKRDREGTTDVPEGREDRRIDFEEGREGQTRMRNGRRVKERRELLPRWKDQRVQRVH